MEGVARFELTYAQWPRCGDLSNGIACNSTRRFAARPGIHIGLFCEAWHPKKWAPGVDWMGASEFAPGGPLHGAVPPNAFPTRRRSSKRREKRFAISEPRRAQFYIARARKDAFCILCRAPWFAGNEKSREAAVWLQRFELSALFARVKAAWATLIPPPTRTDWFDRLPEDLQLEIRYRLEDSELQPDHAFSVRLLRNIEKRLGRPLDEPLRRFAVDGMIFPVCKKCNRGRGDRLVETEEELLTRYAHQYFAGSIANATGHPDYRHFQVLAFYAYRATVSGAEKDRPGFLAPPQVHDITGEITRLERLVHSGANVDYGNNRRR
jgi:hypothetical protein